MAIRNIFVNLPVNDLNKSKEFFSKVGFEFNPQFTNEVAASMVINDNIYAMLLVEDYFKTFITKEIVDSSKSTEVLLALSADSKEEIDEIASKVKAAGGKLAYEPKENGPMYGTSFEDLDGHIWELIYMDPSAIQ
ncbi:VOC family protein [Fredinandcohnia humi]